LDSHEAFECDKTAETPLRVARATRIPNISCIDENSVVYATYRSPRDLSISSPQSPVNRGVPRRDILWCGLWGARRSDCGLSCVSKRSAHARRLLQHAVGESIRRERLFMTETEAYRRFLKMSGWCKVGPGAAGVEPLQGAALVGCISKESLE
jgi:hypothetical protein